MAALPDLRRLRTSLTSTYLLEQLRGAPDTARPHLVMRWSRGADGGLAASWATETAGAISIVPG
ncbi:MAG: hypothetical protein JO157_09400 [Acetobacteraceae bacterium]|nr:hypothetical protein [Acetobacteraceae bacterium]